MMRPNVRTVATRRGTAAAELAAVLPLLMFIFVIGTDFARAFYYSASIANGARNGAVYASIDPDHADTSKSAAYDRMKAVALQDLTDLTPTPTVTWTRGNDASGNPYIDVTVTYDFNTIT